MLFPKGNQLALLSSSSRLIEWSIHLETHDGHPVASLGLCAYADDLLILVKGQSRAELNRRGDETIGIFCDSGTLVGVDIATDKTVMMLLKGRLSHARHTSIRVGENCIRYVTEVGILQ